MIEWSSALTTLMLALVLTAGNIAMLIPLSHRLNLLDIPEGHKTHSLHTPLVGGIGMYLVIFFMVWVKGPWPDVSDYRLLMLVAGVVVLLGAIDDYRHLSFKVRFLVQTVAATLLCYETGLRIDSLGNLLGLGEIPLGVFSLPFTVFALVGAMNAKNMIDGLDGLAGGIALVCLAALAVISTLSGKPDSLAMLLILMAAVAGFLVFNLRLPGRAHAHAFLGDAGSMMLGLVIAYFLIHFAQGDQRIMSPVIALWLFALPLLDVFVVMLRRYQAGRSLFKPSRDHFHHRLMKAGFSVGQTAAILISAQVVFCLIGVLAAVYEAPAYAMFYLALIVFAALAVRTTRMDKLLDTRV